MNDLISRSRLIEEIKRYQMDIVSKATAMKVIRNAPTVTDTNVGGKWIPCSERLPNKDEYLKNDGRFIVTDGNRVYQSIYDIYSAHCFRTLVLFDFGSRSNFEVDNCVIAWMPLPEPYKGETENDES